jgi:hypothetical protein
MTPTSPRSNMRFSNRGIDVGTSVKSFKSYQPSYSNFAAPKSHTKEALICENCGREGSYKVSPH